MGGEDALPFPPVAVAKLAYAAWCAKRARHGGAVTSFEDFCAWFDADVPAGALPSDACRAAWDASVPDHELVEQFEQWCEENLGS